MWLRVSRASRSPHLIKNFFSRLSFSICGKVPRKGYFLLSLVSPCWEPWMTVMTERPQWPLIKPTILLTIAFLAFLPLQHTSTAAEGNPFRYEITSGELVDQPVYTKDDEETFPGEACNCVTYVRNRVPEMPSMHTISPNSEAFVGAIAIEYFGKIKHVSVVTEVHPHGVQVIESNFDHCKTGTRFIPFTKYSLTGFWGM